MMLPKDITDTLPRTCTLLLCSLNLITPKIIMLWYIRGAVSDRDNRREIIYDDKMT